ncbi:MAG: M48 family metalloprotease [Bacteroidaceae bacterium]|nr:M48 family metalloprotease [Bacteroidaceae bacterium]
MKNIKSEENPPKKEPKKSEKSDEKGENKRFSPQLALCKALSEQIYNALQGPVVEEVLKQARTSDNDSYWRSAMEGHSLKVEPRLLSRLHTLFEEVKKKLDFTEKVDFYVTGDSTVNAFSVAADSPGHPHIVNVNSALIDLMTDDELRFVIGHELGHLIDRDTSLLRLINFIFPDPSVMPIALQHKVRLWEQLSELVADRYGYLAVEDLGVCVSAFYKMASGLDLSKMDVALDVLLEENLKHLEYFLKDKGISIDSHPVNPIRVQSLNLFATSKSQRTLNRHMDELISILLKIGNSEIDEPMSIFLATAGLIAASADGEISDDEVDIILEHLAALQMFPGMFLQDISKENVWELFTTAVARIQELDPSMRQSMFTYMIALVLADKQFSQQEIEFLYNIGEEVFNFGRKETAGLLAAMIQQNFVPSTQVLS